MILSLITSNSCNQKCSYCYLHKNPAYQEQDKILLQSLEDGSFFSNIMNAIHSLHYDVKDFDTLDFWGGEPTLYFNKEESLIDHILYNFPNINKISYSTNFSTFDQQIDFIKFFNNYVRHLNLSIQISYDGIFNKITRGVDPIEIKENLKRFILALNKMCLNNLTISINLKATLPWAFYLQLCADVEKYQEYLKHIQDLSTFFETFSLNKNVFLRIENSMIYPTTTSPTHYTQEDGRQFALGAYNLYLHGLPNIPLCLVEKSFTNPSNYCGHMTRQLLFKYDGTLAPCPAGFMDDNEANLEWLKENDPEEYKQLLKSKYLSKEHDYIIKYVAQDLRTSELTFIMSQMYDLAQAGLISPIYKDNEAVRFRHAQYLINLHACYYWNLRTTGSMFTFWNDNIKLFCNGLFEFYDWMKDNGTISN